MRADEPKVLDLSEWDGTPFYQGAPLEGRRVYIVKSEEAGTFLAFGMLEGSREVLFKVRGRLEDEERFLAQVRSEGAAVTFGAPPLDTNTGADKGGSSTTKPGRGEQPR